MTLKSIIVICFNIFEASNKLDPTAITAKTATICPALTQLFLENALDIPDKKQNPTKQI